MSNKIPGLIGLIKREEIKPDNLGELLRRTRSDPKKLNTFKPEGSYFNPIFGPYQKSGSSIKKKFSDIYADLGIDEVFTKADAIVLDTLLKQLQIKPLAQTSKGAPSNVLKVQLRIRNVKLQTDEEKENYQNSMNNLYTAIKEGRNIGKIDLNALNDGFENQGLSIPDYLSSTPKTAPKQAPNPGSIPQENRQLITRLTETVDKILKKFEQYPSQSTQPIQKDTISKFLDALEEYSNQIIKALTNRPITIENKPEVTIKDVGNHKTGAEPRINSGDYEKKFKTLIEELKRYQKNLKQSD